MSVYCIPVCYSDQQLPDSARAVAEPQEIARAMLRLASHVAPTVERGADTDASGYILFGLMGGTVGPWGDVFTRHFGVHLAPVESSTVVVKNGTHFVHGWWGGGVLWRGDVTSVSWRALTDT